jgi:uncharacterized repeat protein (TIGR01451 family)
VRKFLAPVVALGLTLGMAGTVLAWDKPTLTPLCAPDANSYAWRIHLASEDNFVIEWSFSSVFAGAITVDFLTAGDHDFITPRGGPKLHVRWSSDPTTKAKADANPALCEPANEPAIEIRKSSDADGTVAPGTLVTYTYEVENTGNTPLSNVVVHDQIKGSDNVACEPVAFVSGDGGDIGILDVDETWVFSCSTHLQVTTENEACVAAEVGDSAPVEDCADAKVTVSEENVEAGTGTPAASIPNTSLTGDGSSPLPTIIFTALLMASLAALAYTNVQVVRAAHRNR